MSEEARPSRPAAAPPAPCGPRHVRVAATPMRPPTSTAAGSLLAGRYRLGTRVGSDAAAGAEFWRAEDTVLRRDVAATVLRRFGPGDGPGRRRGQPPAPRRSSRGRCGRAASSTPAARGCWTCSPPAPPACPTACSAPPSPSGCPAGASPRPSRTGCSSRSPRPGRCSRWRPPPRRRTGTGSCWAATIPSGCGVNPDGRLQLGFALPRPELTPADDVRGLGAVALRAAHGAVAALAVGRRPRRARRRPSAAPAARPLAPSAVRPACRSSWRRWSSASSAPIGRRARAHRRRRAQRRRRGRGRGGPRGAVPARARRRAAGARRRLAAARRAPTHGRPAAPAQAAVGLAGLGLVRARRRRVHERAARQLFGNPTPPIVVGTAPRCRAGGRCGGPRRRRRRRRAGGRRGDQGRRERRSTTSRGPGQRGPGVPCDRRRPRHGLEDLQLQAAVPRAQAGRRDHDVVRLAGAAVQPGRSTRRARAPRSRSAPRPRRTPRSPTPCCSPAPRSTTASRQSR